MHICLIFTWLFYGVFSQNALGDELKKESVCPKTLKVGVVIPLSAGPTSSGRAVANSVQLAKQKYDLANCIDFLIEDDGLEPKKTVSAVRKLVELDNVNGLIIYGTPTSLAVVDYVEKKQVPMVALSILKRVVENRRYIVKHWCTAEQLNEAILKEVARRRYSTVAVMSTINDAMLGLKDLFIAQSTVKVGLVEDFIKEDVDFRSVAAKIRQTKPAAIYLLIYPPQTNIFVKTLRSVGYPGELFGVHNIEDPSEVAAAGGAMERIWFANGDDRQGEGYYQSYKDKFKVEPALGGASGFDSAKLFIESISSGQDPNSYLHTVKDFAGAFGTYSATGKNDFDFPAVIKEVAQCPFGKPA